MKFLETINIFRSRAPQTPTPPTPGQQKFEEAIAKVIGDHQRAGRPITREEAIFAARINVQDWLND